MSTANLKDRHIGEVKVKDLTINTITVADETVAIDEFKPTVMDVETPSNSTLVSEAAIVAAFPEEESDTFDIRMSGPFGIDVDIPAGLKIRRHGDVVTIDLLGAVGQPFAIANPIVIGIINETFTDLPVKYRPAQTTYFPCTIQNNSAKLTGEFEIDAAGVMEVHTLDANQPNFTVATCGVYNSAFSYVRV
jgi:hypothetical protein